MARQNSNVRPCTCMQVRAIAGLSALALSAFAATSELPQLWMVVLLSGQTAGWTLAVSCAIWCYFARHEQRIRQRGAGALCDKCDLPSFAGSHHCETCDMCISAYSHHSEWLNTCIGSANYTAYLGGLAGLGLAAAFQTTAFIVLLVFLLQDRDTAIRINEKYSVRDHGYLFHLMMHFSLLLSAVLALVNCMNLAVRLWKIISRWWERRNTQRKIFPLVSNPLKPIYSSETPVLSCKLHNDSQDTPTIDRTNGGVCFLSVPS